MVVQKFTPLWAQCLLARPNPSSWLQFAILVQQLGDFAQVSEAARASSLLLICPLKSVSGSWLGPRPRRGAAPALKFGKSTQILQQSAAQLAQFLSATCRHLQDTGSGPV